MSQLHNVILFNTYKIDVVRNAALEEIENGIKFGMWGRNINNLRYIDDITLVIGNQKNIIRQAQQNVLMRLNCAVSCGYVCQNKQLMKSSYAFYCRS